MLLLIMSFAFVSGGKKKVPEMAKEPDTAVGILQEGPDLLAVGSLTTEDWLNVPGGEMTIPNGSNQNSADPNSAVAVVSSVVTGDNPAANSPASETPGIHAAIGMPNTAKDGTLAMTKTSRPEPNAETQPIGTMTNQVTSLAGETKVPKIAASTSVPESPPTSQQKPISGQEITLQPTRTPSGQSMNVAKKDLHETATLQTAASGLSASPLPHSDKDAPTEIEAKAKDAQNTTPKVATGTVHPPAVVTTSDVMRERPAFVRPAVKRSGVMAQSRSLVTERQIQHVRSSVTPTAVAANMPTMSASTPPKPAIVPKQEAEDFARRTTAELRRQGTLRPTQQVRLPRQQETNNTRVWRQEDTPAASDERRPFGLVVEDTAPAFTQEGIPLRTDIPAGASPLKKTGVDQPLWKRP